MTDHLANLRRQSTQRVTDAKARYTRWTMKHGDRLALMHQDVATEVRSLVMDRFYAGAEQSGLNDKDLHGCKMRVASRKRLKTWGPCDPVEAGEQLKAIVAQLGASQRREAA